jgi:hypothetical protein
MKKILSLFAFVAIVISFAACGGNAPEIKDFIVKVTPLSTKAHVVVTPAKADLEYLCDYVKTEDVKKFATIKEYVDDYMVSYPYWYHTNAVHDPGETWDYTDNSLDYNTEYTLFAFYTDGEGVVGDIYTYTFKTLKQWMLNGVFSVSATQKVNFYTSNVLREDNSGPFCYDDQWYSFGKKSGVLYDLHVWDLANFIGSAVLTADEWWYLFRLRPNAEHLFAHATITIDDNDIKGLILLPDNWFLLPEKDKVTTSYDMGIVWDEDDISYTVPSGIIDGYEQNTFTTDQWQELEFAGAVFLPAAGYAPGSDAQGLNQNGFYWSSSASSDTRAYSFYFGQYYIHFLPLREAGFSVLKTNSCAIRLAWPVQ